MKKEEHVENNYGMIISEEEWKRISKDFPCVSLSREDFKRCVEQGRSLDDVRAILRIEVEARDVFDKMVTAIKSRLNRYNKKYPSRLQAFGLFNYRRDECAFVSNFSEWPKGEITKTFFRNCQASREFRDIIVDTYRCLQKAGIDSGDYKTILEG